MKKNIYTSPNIHVMHIQTTPPLLSSGFSLNVNVSSVGGNPVPSGYAGGASLNDGV